MIKTTSLTVVTEQNVHSASFTLKTAKLFTATSRQLEMYLPYTCSSYVHFLKDECKELLDSLFQQCNFQQADFNFSGTARHFTLPYLTPSLEKFGNGLNRTMNVLNRHYIQKGLEMAESLHFIVTFCKGTQ